MKKNKYAHRLYMITDQELKELNISEPAKLFRKQKSKVADKFCRHLKDLEDINKFDYDNDEVYEIKACTQCNKELGLLELKERKRLLNKFKNNLLRNPKRL